MSSSFRLKKRYGLRKVDQDGNVSLGWDFRQPDSTLGMEDHYVLSGTKSCHPDFLSVPIGSESGTRICQRRRRADGGRIDEPQDQEFIRGVLPRARGYRRSTPALYDVFREEPIQRINPSAYHNRRIPFEQDLLRKDLLRAPIRFNGTGIYTTRTPGSPNGDGWYQYGYSYTPDDAGYVFDSAAPQHNEWNIRTPCSGGAAECQKRSIPPYKYDVTRLHQSWPIWRDEQRYHDHGKDPQDSDAGYDIRII